MIDRVHFENFKSLADVTIDLGRFTVLVGANGCGKSSVLYGTYFPSSLASPFVQPDGIARWATDASSATMRFAVRSTVGDQLVFTVTVPTDRNGQGKATFEVIVDGPAGALTVVIHPEVALPSDWNVVRPTIDDRILRFGSMTYLALEPAAMASTSIPVDETPRIDFMGQGLASTLAWMKGAAEDDLGRITRDLGRVVPGVKRVRTFRERVTQRRVKKIDIDGQPIWRPTDETFLGDRFELEFDNGTSVPAELLSEGTLLALGLLTKLYEPQRPKLVLLDDIDRGLHLGAQAQLVRVLRDLMELDAELQFVCTTHSPYLLDLFKPEEVRVLALDEQRHTHVKPLTEHPDFGKWKFGTQTGELWAALGEDWVTKGVGG